MRIGASNYSLLKSYGEEKSIEILAKAGFDCIDYNFESCDEFNNKKLFVGTTDDEFDAYFMHVKKVLDENNIIVGQTHAHTGGIEYTSTKEYFDTVVRSIRATEILGSKYIVIHPLILPRYKYDENKEENKKINMEFFTKITPYLVKHDVKNGFENMWNWDEEKDKICSTACSRPEEIIDYIETLNSDRYVACLDLGHINLTSDTGDTVHGAILKLSKYLEIVHIHDNDKKYDLHLPPFWGDIDWCKVAKAFKSINYKGVLNYEVSESFFDKFGRESVQSCANYLAENARLLKTIIKNSL